MYMTPAPERIFILNIYIIPCGRDLLNVKEVISETLSQMNANICQFVCYALEEAHESKVYCFVISLSFCIYVIPVFNSLV